MFSHVTIGTNNLAKARDFYDVVCGTMGILRGFEGSTFISYGDRNGGRFFVMSPYNGDPATTGNGTHVAFRAKTRAEVNAFHASALAYGGTDEGAPGLRPHYHEHYYGAYVRDLDGNKLQAVCHDPK